MTDHTDIVERLKHFCTDWDGSAMDDHTTPMDGLHCIELREAAAEITRLRAEAEALRKALRDLIVLESDGHHASENSIEAWERAHAALDATKGTT